jgi:hypothetical protein
VFPEGDDEAVDGKSIVRGPYHRQAGFEQPVSELYVRLPIDVVRRDPQYHVPRPEHQVHARAQQHDPIIDPTVCGDRATIPMGSIELTSHHCGQPSSLKARHRTPMSSPRSVKPRSCHSTAKPAVSNARVYS